MVNRIDQILQVSHLGVQLAHAGIHVEHGFRTARKSSAI